MSHSMSHANVMSKCHIEILHTNIPYKCPCDVICKMARTHITYKCHMQGTHKNDLPKLRTMLQAHVAHKCAVRMSHANATYKCRCIHTTSQASVTSKADMQMLRTHVTHTQWPHNRTQCPIHMSHANATRTLHAHVPYESLRQCCIQRVAHAHHIHVTCECHIYTSCTNVSYNVHCTCHVQVSRTIVTSIRAYTCPIQYHKHMSQTNVTYKCHVRMLRVSITCQCHAQCLTQLHVHISCAHVAHWVPYSWHVPM